MCVSECERVRELLFCVCAGKAGIGRLISDTIAQAAEDTLANILNAFRKCARLSPRFPLVWLYPVCVQERECVCVCGFFASCACRSAKLQRDILFPPVPALVSCAVLPSVVAACGPKLMTSEDGPPPSPIRVPEPAALLDDVGDVSFEDPKESDALPMPAIEVRILPCGRCLCVCA